jgi:hypothetical protein
LLQWVKERACPVTKKVMVMAIPYLPKEGDAQSYHFRRYSDLNFIDGRLQAYTLFAWLISHQPAFSQNKSGTSNQSAVLFSQNRPAPAISHQRNEQTDNIAMAALATQILEFSSQNYS